MKFWSDEFSLMRALPKFKKCEKKLVCQTLKHYYIRFFVAEISQWTWSAHHLVTFAEKGRYICELSELRNTIRWVIQSNNGTVDRRNGGIFYNKSFQNRIATEKNKLQCIDEIKRSIDNYFWSSEDRGTMRCSSWSL